MDELHSLWKKALKGQLAALPKDDENATLRKSLLAELDHAEKLKTDKLERQSVRENGGNESAPANLIQYFFSFSEYFRKTNFLN